MAAESILKSHINAVGAKPGAEGRPACFYAVFRLEQGLRGYSDRSIVRSL